METSVASLKSGEDKLLNVDMERYAFLMEESVRLYPCACQYLVHAAVCEQLLEEQGVEYDEDKISEFKNLYCKKLEYENMIQVEN